MARQVFKQKLNNVKAFVLDVDGVLTNGDVLILNNGEFARTMSTRDGFAMMLAKKKGYEICVITAGQSEAVRDRMERLGVTDVHIDVTNKVEVLKNFIRDKELDAEQVLYMGDDLPDYRAIQIAGVKTCPADAAEDIKALCDYISDMKGGQGCVRDVIEQTLRLHGNWPIDGNY
ncbi:MAG: HAD hydrolase-like protein [Bacteroidetes bacterium]|nr:HAD hydrolase-like protein [Bacteroidota bacterium]